MKLRTAITFVGLPIIVILIALAIYINHREALVEDGQIQLSGLHGSVDIYFDNPAVPYIQAGSQEDLIYAQGFVTASERLFQMDIFRRLARGEMAAVFGGSSLPNDRLARIIGFRRIAEAEYDTLSSPTKRWLDCYCQGVNAFISQGHDRLPLEFILLGYSPQVWHPIDTLAILKYLQYASDECWQLNVLQNSIKEKGGTRLVRQMFGRSSQLPELESQVPSFAANKIAALPNLKQAIKNLPPPAELSWGSNGWVISNKISQSGGCLLACDKHNLFTFPDLFFSCSLRSPGIHVAGMTIPGVPGIVIGRNDHIAWAPVSLKGRWQDLNYVNSQEWAKGKEFEEEISQRFANNVIEKVSLTKYGPLLVRGDQTGAALSWYGLNAENNIIESIKNLNVAQSFSEFRTALQTYKGSPQVFLYADTAGNISNLIAGYKAKELSLALADEKQSEYIVANALSPEVSARFSALGALCNSPAAMRAFALLKTHKQSGQPITLEDMIVLQSDSKASLSELVVHSLRNALQITGNIDQYQQQALSRLSVWDGQLKSDSNSACLYESFITELTRQALNEQIGTGPTCDYFNKWPRWSDFTKQLIDRQSEQFLPLAQRSLSFFLANSFLQSLQNLHLTWDLQQGQSSISGCQWQNLHQADVRPNLSKFIPELMVNAVSLFLPGSVGLSGDQDCIDACNYSLDSKSFQYNCNSAPTARLIIDMADNDKFYQALSFGQCAHLFSGDRINQSNCELDLWRNMKFHTIAFSDKELGILAVHHLTLVTAAE